jgi:hypothetical protein
MGLDKTPFKFGKKVDILCRLEPVDSWPLVPFSEIPQPHASSHSILTLTIRKDHSIFHELKGNFRCHHLCKPTVQASCLQLNPNLVPQKNFDIIMRYILKDSLWKLFFPPQSAGTERSLKFQNVLLLFIVCLINQNIFYCFSRVIISNLPLFTPVLQMRSPRL